MGPVGGKIQNQKVLGGVKSITKTEKEFVITYETKEQAKLNVLNEHVFRYFLSPSGDFPAYPKPHNQEDVAKIIHKELSEYNQTPFEESVVQELEESFVIHTNKIKIIFKKKLGTFTVIDKRTEKIVFSEVKPISYEEEQSVQTLKQHDNEFYFGGGMQNGRFTHKGQVIDILNTNNWVDGGVTSPSPFYWSTYGFGVLRNTWQPGQYDFGAGNLKEIKTTHEEQDFDAFFFINENPRDLLGDYFELTGKPIFMPEYAFYEAHLNAFNRDYWVKVTPDTTGAILFEDGEYYKSYQPKDMPEDKVGILESLNGEKDNYQFSARAMVDRYKKHDLPLAWFVPNDGYGSGYGQTDSLHGDIQNLKEFADYARSNGVEVALWTESQLEPKDPANPKKGERDLRKEVSVAGVVALKCDVAWIGEGYSFAHNAVENAASMFSSSTRARTMIIMVDGWAGTQRHSGIWSGDQKGGEWEYIRFHIPTYIGSGLSGQPVIGSDMDGIYAGKLREVNIRDFQWKTFTPLQLNMDGWGWIPKTPFSFDDEATAINRAYLKFKSMMMPYNYTIGHESINGLPMIRAMFLEFPKEKSAFTDDSKYQFMWGPNILVAPVYNPKGVIDGALRDGIYLPDSNQVWIDIFTGEKYQGGKFLNNMKYPLWKIPVFVKDGAIIPLTNPNNNPYEIKRDARIFLIYPNGETSFVTYEDDGFSSDYLEGQSATTKIEVLGPNTNEHGDLYINIHKTEGQYNNMVNERSTELRIVATENIKSIKTAVNGKSIDMNKVESKADFEKGRNVYYFDEDFAINPYLNEATNEKWSQKFLLIKLEKFDVTSSHVQLKIKGFENKGKVFGANDDLVNTLQAPKGFAVLQQIHKDVTLRWNEVFDATYYEIERDGVIFTNITGIVFTFEDLKYENKYSFRIRSVITEGVSEWSEKLVVLTDDNPYKNVIRVVKVSSNYPCQKGQEVCRLTDGNPKTMWHTHWYKPKTGDDEDIKLTFDFGEVYSVDKMEYVPRDDFGNGTIKELHYNHSIDGKAWSEMSELIGWDGEERIAKMNGAKMRYVQLILKSTVGGFASGKQILFYKQSE